MSIADSAPGAAAYLDGIVSAALGQLQELGINGPRGHYSLSESIEVSCRDADFVIEAVTERLAVKSAVIARVESTVAHDCLIATTTSSFTPSQVQSGMRFPGRLVAAHPFNPPHLVPLVELSAGGRSDPGATAVAAGFFRTLGLEPVLLKREATGHLANRLTAALYREAVNLVAEGIATVEDVDAAVRYGPGLRWAIMGPHMTYHLAAGDGGYRRYLEHLGPTQEARWKDLGDPRLTPELCDKLVAGVMEESRGRSLAELREIRDSGLVALRKVLHPRSDDTT